LAPCRRTTHRRSEFVTDPEALTAALAELETAKADHQAVYERWIELTEKMGG